MNMDEYFSQLVGATINSYSSNEEDPSIDPFPTFVMTLKNGEKVTVEVSRDPEGNGGGFLFIGEEIE